MAEKREVFGEGQDLIQDLLDSQCILHHIISDPRQLHDPLRDLPVRIYHSVVSVRRLTVDHLHHADLHDLFVTGTDARRLKIQGDIRIYHFICHVCSPSLLSLHHHISAQFSSYPCWFCWHHPASLPVIPEADCSGVS